MALVNKMAVLNKQGAVPLYMQLKQLIEGEIAVGALAAHSRVPSERELSEQFGISRMTARQALAELIQEGRLYTSVGKGTFVAEPKIHQNLQSLTSFTQDMLARGLMPTTRLLRREFVPASATIASRCATSAKATMVRERRFTMATTTAKPRRSRK